MTGLVANVATGYVLYKIISKITTPFKDWDAYETGVIDEFGNILVRKDKRSQEQWDSWTKLDIMCRNLKRILQRIPGGDSKLATYSAALYLIREGKDDYNGLVKFISENNELVEMTIQEKDKIRLETKKRVKEKLEQERKEQLIKAKQNWDQ